MALEWMLSLYFKNPELPDGDTLVGDLVGFTGMEHYFYGPNLTKYLAELRKMLLSHIRDFLSEKLQVLVLNLANY